MGCLNGLCVFQRYKIKVPGDGRGRRVRLQLRVDGQSQTHNGFLQASGLPGSQFAHPLQPHRKKAHRLFQTVFLAMLRE